MNDNSLNFHEISINVSRQSAFMHISCFILDKNANVFLSVTFNTDFFKLKPQTILCMYVIFLRSAQFNTKYGALNTSRFFMYTLHMMVNLGKGAS